jgi:hypothetical protein
MKHKTKQGFIFIAVIITLLVACAHTDSVRAIDLEDMIKLESSIIYLTAKADDLYRTNAIPPGADDEVIFNMATEKNQNIKEDFKRYMVKFKSELGHAVVLVCVKNGQQALLEKAACSLGPDKKHWESSQPIPCKFTIDAQYMEKVCEIRK